MSGMSFVVITNERSFDDGPSSYKKVCSVAVDSRESKIRAQWHIAQIDIQDVFVSVIAFILIFVFGWL
jgi:hypothetical protein